MALSDLIARLEQDVETQVEAIARQADAEVRAIEAAAAQAAAEATESQLAHRRDEQRLAHQRELARARRQAHARELEARHALLARILDRAGHRLQEAVASPRYATALSTCLEEALSYLEGLPARVRCGVSEATLLRPIVSRRPGVDLVVDESIGPGLVAEAGDGSVVVDNTLAARLRGLETRLAAELLAGVGHDLR